MGTMDKYSAYVGQKTAKHTPGPWRVTPNASHIYTNMGVGHDGVICKMPHAGPIQWACDPASTENSANARLIASAPDLLAERDALRERVTELEATLKITAAYVRKGVADHAFDDLPSCAMSGKEALDRADAALAKVQS